jgi:hypothetical protein
MILCSNMFQSICLPVYPIVCSCADFNWKFPRRFLIKSDMNVVPYSYILEVEVEVKLQPTVSWPVRLGVRHPSETRDQFFFLLEIIFRQFRQL